MPRPARRRGSIGCGRWGSRFLRHFHETIVPGLGLHRHRVQQDLGRGGDQDVREGLPRPGARVGGEHLERATRGQRGDGFLGLEDGQRAVKALGVEYLVGHVRALR